VIVAVYWVLYRRASPRSGITPLKYVTHPPSDLPPAMVGTLFVPEMTPDKLAATVLDLVRRGVIVMDPAPPSPTGRPSDDRILRRRRDRMAGLRPFEQDFVYELFDHIAGGEETRLSQLREWWVAHPVTSGVAEEILAVRLNQALLAEGLADPHAARRRQWLSGYGVAVAFLVVLGPLLGPWSFLFLVVGSALVITAQRLPSLSNEGEKQAERYRGFRRYLRDYGRMDEKPAESVAVWEDYLPLAMVLGVGEKAEDDLDVTSGCFVASPGVIGMYPDAAEGMAYMEGRRAEDPSLPELTVVEGKNAGLRFTGSVQIAGVGSPREYLRHVRRHPARALIEPAPWILLPLAMAVFYLVVLVVVR
jgi:hypothetical protein